MYVCYRSTSKHFVGQEITDSQYAVLSPEDKLCFSPKSENFNNPGDSIVFLPDWSSQISNHDFGPNHTDFSENLRGTAYSSRDVDFGGGDFGGGGGGSDYGSSDTNDSSDSDSGSDD